MTDTPEPQFDPELPPFDTDWAIKSLRQFCLSNAIKIAEDQGLGEDETVAVARKFEEYITNG